MGQDLLAECDNILWQSVTTAACQNGATALWYCCSDITTFCAMQNIQSLTQIAKMYGCFHVSTTRMLSAPEDAV